MMKGHYFNWSESVAVYLRVHSSSQCKLSGMFVNLVPPVTVTFDELFHFDLTVKPRRQNMYYFLRIEVVAFDLEHPEVLILQSLLIVVCKPGCGPEKSEGRLKEVGIRNELNCTEVSGTLIIHPFPGKKWGTASLLPPHDTPGHCTY